MPKLPPEDRGPLFPFKWPKVLKVAFVEAREAGEGCAGISKSWFAGEEIIESDVINDEITSGEAGCTCTRFEECAEGPCSDLRRACCLVRLGIGGGVVFTSMVRIVLDD
jgi:hypothetical protein